MAVLIAPLIALAGLMATFFIVRTRWRVKKSLYSSLRLERRRQLETARMRALGSSIQAAAVAGSAPAEAGEAAGSGDKESPLHAVAGYISLAAALATVLLGVLLAIGLSPLR